MQPLEHKCRAPVNVKSNGGHTETTMLVGTTRTRSNCQLSPQPYDVDSHECFHMLRSCKGTSGPEGDANLLEPPQCLYFSLC